MSTTNGGNRRWKKHEQGVADALGTVRVPNIGVRGSDLESGQYGIEVKTMKAIPVRVRRALDQSVDACAKTSRIPVVVLSEPRAGRKPLRFVVMRFEDWMANNAPRDE